MPITITGRSATHIRLIETEAHGDEKITGVVTSSLLPPAIAGIGTTPVIPFVTGTSVMVLPMVFSQPDAGDEHITGICHALLKLIRAHGKSASVSNDVSPYSRMSLGL